VESPSQTPHLPVSTIWQSCPAAGAECFGDIMSRNHRDCKHASMRQNLLSRKRVYSLESAIGFISRSSSICLDSVCQALAKHERAYLAAHCSDCLTTLCCKKQMHDLVQQAIVCSTCRKLSMSSLVSFEPSAETTTSKGRSVHLGWGMAITAASSTWIIHITYFCFLCTLFVPLSVYPVFSYFCSLCTLFVSLSVYPIPPPPSHAASLYQPHNKCSNNPHLAAATAVLPQLTPVLLFRLLISKPLDDICMCL